MASPDANPKLYKMSNAHSQIVIDISPWPLGLGFKDASAWWAYIGSQTETRKLELLLTTALLSDEACQLLLSHDQALFDAFQLSIQTVALISDIQAKTLVAFTQALLLKCRTEIYAGDDKS